MMWAFDPSGFYCRVMYIFFSELKLCELLFECLGIIILIIFYWKTDVNRAYISIA